MYGDPAYALRLWLQCPFQGNNLTADQLYFNQIMSTLRITVEYGFQRIIILFAFLDFKKHLKLYLQPIGKYYVVGALLSNLHGILNVQTETSIYFDVEMPLIDDYLFTAFN